MDSKKHLPVLFRFVVILLLQLFISGVLNFTPLLFIAIYPLFLITLPPNYPVKKLLWWSFALGVAVDLLSGGIIGLSSAASLVMALFRKALLKLIYTKGEQLDLSFIEMRELGLIRFSTYVTLSLLIHHIAVLLIESFTFDLFLALFPRFIISILVNLALILIIEYALLFRRTL